MAKGATDQFQARHIYRAFRAERNQALHHVLGRLPDAFIVALIEGLENGRIQDTDFTKKQKIVRAVQIAYQGPARHG